MLEPWIIEEIRRREREREEQQRVPLELPVPMPYWREPPEHDHETSPPPADRGVIIIDL